MLTSNFSGFREPGQDSLGFSVLFSSPLASPSVFSGGRATAGGGKREAGFWGLLSLRASVLGAPSRLARLLESKSLCSLASGCVRGHLSGDPLPGCVYNGHSGDPVGVSGHHSLPRLQSPDKEPAATHSSVRPTGRWEGAEGYFWSPERKLPDRGHSLSAFHADILVSSKTPPAWAQDMTRWWMIRRSDRIGAQRGW